VREDARGQPAEAGHPLAQQLLLGLDVAVVDVEVGSGEGQHGHRPGWRPGHHRPPSTPAVQTQLLDRVAARLARVETRQRFARFLDGMLAELPRKNCRTIVEHAGEQRPDGMQHLLNRANWNTEGIAGWAVFKERCPRAASWSIVVILADRAETGCRRVKALPVPCWARSRRRSRWFCAGVGGAPASSDP
jgi:hypothetical protein